MHLEPVAFDAGFADANAGGESAPVIASGTIGGNECGHEAVGDTALGFFAGLGHGDDYFTPGKSVALAGVETAAHGAPVMSGRGGGGGVAVGGSALEIDDGQLAFVAAGIIL